VSTWDSAEKLNNKEENEAKARKVIAKQFAHFPWISQTIEQYERKDTKEAQFVFALDKLIALLIRRLDKGQAYIHKKLTKTAFQKGLTPSRSKAQAHPAIGEYYEELWEIFDSHPEYFFQPNPLQ
jgi:5'-deoxynucleotidase YfbR-like HD superfamily hydrolase